MSKRLGPIHVICDAPPHDIVEACAAAGFLRRAQDVRWCRLSRFLDARSGWHACFLKESWRLLGPIERPGRRYCSCGQELPNLDAYEFRDDDGGRSLYLLGQCSRCQTVFWENT